MYLKVWIRGAKLVQSFGWGNSIHTFVLDTLTAISNEETCCLEILRRMLQSSWKNVVDLFFQYYLHDVSSWLNSSIAHGCVVRHKLFFLSLFYINIDSITYLRYFLGILKVSLQNFQKLLKKCFMWTISLRM